jgi:hypothetical protein
MDLDLATNGDRPATDASVRIPEQTELTIGQTGMTARRNGEYVAVMNRDGTEIFTFNKSACPFSEQAIFFLIEIYSIGYRKGLVIGRDVCKARIRELLGPEI